MARLRRLTALIAMVLLAELLLVGSGFACALPGPRDGSAASVSGMMAADAASPDAASPDAANPDAANPDADCPDAMPAPGVPAERPGHEMPPCPLPWAPAGCHGVFCAPATLASSSRLPVAATAAGERPVLAVLAPSSVARAPELPPPRA